MARPKSTKDVKDATRDRCEALARLCAGKVSPPFDCELIAHLVGDRTVATLAEVGKAFGVAAGTPKKEWRPAGMPGEPKAWNLPEITVWFLERAAKESERTKANSNPGNERIKEIDLRLAELNLSKKTREEQEASGRTVDVFIARAELAAFLAVCRDQLLAMPRTLNPLLPSDCRDAITELIKAEVRKVLTYIVEGSQRALEKNTSEHYAKILRQVDDIERNDARNGSE